VFVDDEQGKCAIGFARGIARQQGVVIGGLQHHIAGAGEVLHEFETIKDRVTGVGVAEDAEVAVGPPAVERGTEVAGVVGAVPQIPPEESIELGLHQLREAVGQVESVDNTRGLSALGAGIVVVLRAKEFNVGAASAEVVGDLLAQVGGIGRPIGGRQQ